MIGKIASMGLYSGLTIETTLDPKTQPFLHDHQIDGTPVLPGVMGIEAFAEAALCMLPGWHVEAVEEVNFLAPFKFYRNEPRTLTIEASIHSAGRRLGGGLPADRPPHTAESAEPQITTHFTGSRAANETTARSHRHGRPGSPTGSPIEAADIYRLYFHGPAYQVVERAWWDGNGWSG